MNRLKNKTAIVCGTAQGAGLAIATAFVEEGARVALVDIHERRGREAGGALTSKGAEVCFIELDVADFRAVNAMVARATECLGGPNVLINNAGVAVFRESLETAAEDWRGGLGRGLELQLRGAASSASPLQGRHHQHRLGACLSDHPEIFSLPIFASALYPEKPRAETSALHPVKRIGRPEEIAAAVFLASDEARFLTAQNIVIDGGRSVVFPQ
ncbi:NAD(P)-dependent dehydrogenase (short-subunit alcohol dehydrogenase family) [Bradyrhizobium sp. USDA 4503]